MSGRFWRARRRIASPSRTGFSLSIPVGVPYDRLTDGQADRLKPVLLFRLGFHDRLAAAGGLLVRNAAGLLQPTATAREFLVAGSTFDARAYYAALADKPGVVDFLKVLRTGRPAH